MYDQILAQPAAFADVVVRNRALLPELAGQIVSRGCKLFLVGIGTSYHTAQIGGHLFRIFAPNVDCQVWHSFDFVRYGPRLSGRDVVMAVSHRGVKQFTLLALERAQQVGCFSALVAGQSAPPCPVKVSALFETVEQEKSAAHTVSHIGSVGVLAELTRQVAGGSALDPRLLDETIPNALAAGLSAEEQMSVWASEHQHRRRIWLVGAGPSAVTAHEVALKIKETSYLQAEALAIETLLHGPFQCCEAKDLFILIAPSGPAQTRLQELPRMIAAIGAKCVFVTDQATAFDVGKPADKCIVPTVAEPLEALTCLVPLQLFTYHLALNRGTNPDSFRLDDPRFATAMESVKL